MLLGYFYVNLSMSFLHTTYGTTTSFDNAGSMCCLCPDNPVFTNTEDHNFHYRIFHRYSPVKNTDRDIRTQSSYSSSSRLNTAEFTTTRYSHLPAGFRTDSVGAAIRRTADGLMERTTNNTTTDITPTVNINTLNTKMEIMQKQLYRFDSLETELASVKTLQTNKFQSFDAELSSVKMKLNRFDIFIYCFTISTTDFGPNFFFLPCFKVRNNRNRFLPIFKMILISSSPSPWDALLAKIFTVI